MLGRSVRYDGQLYALGGIALWAIGFAGIGASVVLSSVVGGVMSVALLVFSVVCFNRS